ncbi:S8 family peptidase [Desulfogranum marinum]|uniref:S8 family peptidase n=1 Tax=Desulfogranum marinum TaxID=453220 RepID=UPI0029C96955|nr:S8 family peptidase [Desulfogranum marinum]
MDEFFPHIPLQREEPVNDKRPGRPPRFTTPDDTAAHGKGIQEFLTRATVEADLNEGGFDERRLFRFVVEEGFSPDDLPKIASPEFRNEIEVVSQEGKEVVVAFVSDAALESFEALLTTLASGDVPANKQVFYALQGVDGWKPIDRMGWALKQQGIPEEEIFMLDVELWPLEDSPQEREKLWVTFEDWLNQQGVSVADSVKQPGLSLYRVKCNKDQTESLLRYRDVRTVDLPPRFGVDIKLLFTDISEFDEVPAPPEDAPGVVILDSGLITGHPLLSPAVGDSASFLPGKDPSDENGHGTLVGGLALYGDVESRIQGGKFVPEIHLFSGRILDEKNENGTGFVAKHITEAVHYFLDEYDCRVFNLSFGDLNKPYLGGHVRELAYTLDTLSRELSVLFIVSAGNVLGNQLAGLDWKKNYPRYLFEDSWAIVDPATAMNVLTVGSVARYDQTVNSRRYANDPAEIPIASVNQPSPFTRRGPTVGGAIKPELMGYGGNWAINTRAGANALVANSGLGELSTNWKSVTDGRLFADDSGTSFAAPHVSYLATLLQKEVPGISPDLTRALLVAHARIPEEVEQLLGDNGNVRAVCGYGMVYDRGLFRSLENEATLTTEGLIPNKKHHFYEIPVPDDFLSKGRRVREISLALAYTPYVRSTRIDYRASRVQFKLVAAENLDEVTKIFNQATDKETYEAIKEIGTEMGAGNRNVSSTLRNKGTVQSATWYFKQFNSNAKLVNNRLFVVVTRHDFPWGELHSATDEKYALVVTFRDRENGKAKLYTQIRQKLQARARVQV